MFFGGGGRGSTTRCDRRQGTNRMGTRVRSIDILASDAAYAMHQQFSKNYWI